MSLLKEKMGERCPRPRIFCSHPIGCLPLPRQVRGWESQPRGTAQRLLVTPQEGKSIRQKAEKLFQHPGCPAGGSEQLKGGGRKDEGPCQPLPLPGPSHPRDLPIGLSPAPLEGQGLWVLWRSSTPSFPLVSAPNQGPLGQSVKQLPAAQLCIQHADSQ